MKRVSTLLVAGTFTILFLVLSWSAAYGEAGTDTLWGKLEEKLNAGESLVLPDGERTLTMENDGNLVLYGPEVEKLLWQSGTSGNPGACYAMQDDGNLVIYSGDLLGYWNLDEGSGTMVADSSGHGYDGTLHNSPAWSTDTPSSMDFADPYALGFNRTGSAEYVTMSGTTEIDQAQELTLSTWVRPDSTTPYSTYMRFITLGNEKAVLRVLYEWGGTRQLQFYMNIGGSLRGIHVHHAWAAGTWYHVAGTYDGSIMRLYLDGVELGTYSISDEVAAGNGILLSHYNSEALDGLLDDVRIYSRALSSTEINDLTDDVLLWESGTSGNPGAYYVMDEDNGNLVVYSPDRPAPLWESGTSGNPGAYYVMQDDGNLVVYSADGSALWASGTWGHPGAELFIADGNLAIFSKPLTEPVWSSQTDGNPGAVLVMESNGDLVIYSAEGTALWSTGTDGNPGATYRMSDGELQVWRPPHCEMNPWLGWVCWPEMLRWQSWTAGVTDPVLVMQEDGNLVINSTSSTLLWETGTGGHPDSELVMEEDGNLVLYSRSEPQVLWESGTAADDHAGAELVMHDDGNLVIRMPLMRKAIWSSNTSGNPGALAKMQANGDLSIYAPDAGSYKSIWNIGKNIWPIPEDFNPYLKLQTDGNLVVYHNGEPQWATSTFLAWMEKLGNAIGGFSIRELAIPGTHDTGTYGLNDRFWADDGNMAKWLFDIDGYAPGHVEVHVHWTKHYTSWWPHIPYWTVHVSLTPHAKLMDMYATTQGANVYEQLHNGIRYLDLRVLYDRKHLYLIHTLKGPNVFTKINDVNHYLRENPYEIVILDFQSFYTQNGSETTTPDKWNGKLIDHIHHTLGDLLIPPPADVNALTMYDIWASGKQVIVFYNQDPPAGKDTSKFWSRDNKLRSEWFNQQSWWSGAGKIGLGQAINDEALCVQTLGSGCGDANTKLWVLQGQLTFNIGTIATYLATGQFSQLAAWLRGNKDAAESVNDKIRSWALGLEPEYTREINILIGDWAGTSDLVQTAIQLNLKKAGLDHLNHGIEGLPLNMTQPDPPPATQLHATAETIPEMVPPAHIRLEATGAWTAVELGEGSAYDHVDGWLEAAHDAGGASFPIGTHTITWSSSDPAGVTGTATQTVRIVAHTPVAEETVLWPPNHKMSTVTIQANVVPSLQGLVTLSAYVASNEPEEGQGDGDKAPDWGEPEIDQENGIIRIPLRAERMAQGYGRVYTVTVVATDSEGHQSEAIVHVDVPRDRSDKE